MYAIIQTGGKQYRVTKDDIIDVELLSDTKDGTVEFSNVLFVHDGKKALVGTPNINGSLVKGEFIGDVKGPKVIAYKYKRRKSFHKKIGHRQKYSRVKIVEIVSKGEN